MITRTGPAGTYAAILGLLLLAALFTSLGTWQLERAQTSEETLAQFASGAADGVLATLPRELDAEARFRRVEIDGEYVTEPQFLLDNMVQDGVAGYYVLTALRVPGIREHVLVNRGWVPAGNDRRVLPDVDVGVGPRSVSGRLERLPRPGMRLGNGEGAAAGGETVVLQYPTAAELALRLGEPVLDYQVLLDASGADGYVREWRAPGVTPERHLSYAGQWLALALGACAAAIVMALRTARRKP